MDGEAHRQLGAAVVRTGARLDAVGEGGDEGQGAAGAAGGGGPPGRGGGAGGAEAGAARGGGPAAGGDAAAVVADGDGDLVAIGLGEDAEAAVDAGRVGVHDDVRARLRDGEDDVVAARRVDAGGAQPAPHGRAGVGHGV